ncbi:MAG: hypothetical protein KC589_05250 [Nanoarchaeota archaeon]|nr:hypothetical protein [Nanoarchaeota archaeon]
MNKTILIFVTFLVIFASCSQVAENNTDSKPVIEEENNQNSNTKENKIEEETKFSYEDYCTDNKGTWNTISNDCEYISKEACENKSGSYSECESACRNDPDAQICTMQCVSVCKFNEESSQNIIVDINGNKVDSNCKTWFDGCNNCQISDNGLLMCTRKFCSQESLENPRCLD